MARTLIGALLAVAAFTPIFIGARALRGRLMADLAGPCVALAAIVIALAIVIVVSEALGSIGALRPLPLAVGLAVIGVVAARTKPRAHLVGTAQDVPDDEAAPPIVRARPVTRTWDVIAVGIVAVVGAEWMTRIVDAWHRGITTPDSLWYHLPIAARFAQDGWTSRLHFVDQASLIVFFPATAELVHALGMVFIGNDFVSLGINLGWLALALLAAWCIGWRFGVAPLTLIGAAVVLATPALVLDEAGSGLNDIAGIALFLAALALIINAGREGIDNREQRAELLCASLAAGLAAGTKYTMIGPALALGIAAITITPRPNRVRLGLGWAAVAFTTGGYWYLRNLFTVGNPVPSMRLSIGPLHLPSIPYPGTSSIAHYVLQRAAWRLYFVPGLRVAFGPLWWALVAIVGVGFAIGLARPNRPARLLAGVGIACTFAFVVTPQILGAHAPIFFTVNARYVTPALIAGVVLLPIAMHNASQHRLSALLATYVVVFAGTQFASSLWRNEATVFAPSTVGALPYLGGITFGLIVFVVGVRFPRRPHLRRGRSSPALVFVCGSLGLLAGAAVLLSAEQYYSHHRYQQVQPLVAVNRWAQSVHHSRIAIVDLVLQYPFYGTDLSNHVQYLAIRHGDGASERIPDCRAWRQALNDGRYKYVIAASPGFPLASTRPASEMDWTRSDPSAHLVAEDSFGPAHAWVFELRGAMHPSACTAEPKS